MNIDNALATLKPIYIPTGHVIEKMDVFADILIELANRFKNMPIADLNKPPRLNVNSPVHLCFVGASGQRFYVTHCDYENQRLFGRTKELWKIKVQKFEFSFDHAKQLTLSLN